MSPRLDLGPRPRLGYTQSLIDRAAEKRLDTAWLAARLADPRTLAYVIGGELIVLKKGGDVHDPTFTPEEARALAPNHRDRVPRPDRRRRALRHRTDAGERGGAQGAQRSRRHRPALDRDPGAGRARPPAAAGRGQGDAALARAAPVLLQLRGRDRHGRRRLEAQLPGLQGRSFSAHRSGGHHAGGARRPRPARPLRPVRRHHVVLPCRLRRAGRGDRGRGAARDAGGGRHPLRARELPVFAALAVSDVADDRLPCRGAQRRHRHGPERAGGRALVQQGRMRGDADAKAPRRTDLSAAGRHRPSHHPRWVESDGALF